jgi:aspartyl-tRNA(Asn)/glutamyl-tRNA(Gln) amidotransferase subunit B
MSAGAAVNVTPEVLARYEPVIGLEVHVQLATRTKIFCGCPTSFGAPPNTNVCPVCLGLPGPLPVLNRAAVELAIKAALALHCAVRGCSRFARKNYFYPDLPKGYQISQYDQPLAEHGSVEINLDGVSKRIGVTRVHLEDDAGKSLHEGFRDSDRYTYVDLNRCGTPLIEIVSDPDMRSSDEAYAFLTELKLLLQFVEVSSCDMEKGHLRCDANVSVRLRGAERFGTRAEVKNLNSFRFLKMALDYEIGRQIAVIEGGGTITQETRLYNSDSGETVGMRSKEHAHDYRYFPEPDLLPLRIRGDWLERIRGAMPELPPARRARFVRDYGLREYDAQVLTASRELSDYYEKAAAASGDPRAAAHWVMGDLLGALKAEGKEITASPVSPERLGELVALIAQGEITGKLAKEIFPKIFASAESPRAILEREGLRQISDAAALGQVIDQVLAANPKQVEQYKGGKTAVRGFLMGQVMKATRGQANPAAVNQLLKEKLT